MDPDDLRSLMVVLRRGRMSVTDIGGIAVRYSDIDEFNRIAHEIDMNATGGFPSGGGAGAKEAERFSTSALMEEAIASSIANLLPDSVGYGGRALSYVDGGSGRDAPEAHKPDQEPNVARMIAGGTGHGGFDPLADVEDASIITHHNTQIPCGSVRRASEGWLLDELSGRACVVRTAPRLLAPRPSDGQEPTDALSEDSVGAVRERSGRAGPDTKQGFVCYCAL
ncbi:MAG: hypothetical protein LBS92_06175 [Candidatus Methanoplasma sp.]|jgi:hypothetical protein|nr:hypothetical protein [Candidatus Methanoplasma sp.]